jgi:DNA-binding transcriptional MerR regulator
VLYEALDINALSRETGINVRTIRYYLAEGLLPVTRGTGTGGHLWRRPHRDRLRLIRRPLARSDQRRLDELLDKAQRLFDGET